MLYVAVDPGLNGALAAILPIKPHNLNPCPIFWDTPTTTTKKQRTKKKIRKIQEYDIGEMATIIREILGMGYETTFFIEDIHFAGNTGAFKFGKGYGIWLGILGTMRIKLNFVRPQVWKKEFGLLKKEKDAARLKAIKLFPQIKDQLTRKKDVDRADALLIAEYGRRISQ